MMSSNLYGHYNSAESPTGERVYDSSEPLRKKRLPLWIGARDSCHEVLTLRINY